MHRTVSTGRQNYFNTHFNHVYLDIVISFLSSPSMLVGKDSKAESLSPRERAVSFISFHCDFPIFCYVYYTSSLFFICMCRTG